MIHFNGEDGFDVCGLHNEVKLFEGQRNRQVPKNHWGYGVHVYPL